MGLYGSKDQHPKLAGSSSENDYLASIQWQYCEKCGNKHLKEYKKCPACGHPHKHRMGIVGKCWLCIAIVIGAVIIFAYSRVYFSVQDKASSSKQYVPTTSAQSPNTSAFNTSFKPNIVTQKVETSQEYMAKCQQIDYDTLARNPNKYKGEYLTMSGEVIQTIDIDGGVMLRMDVTQDDYGFWHDTIVVTIPLAPSDDRILEDDIITVYGKCYGLYTYESVLGSTISVPRIDGKYYILK